jgi:hypothetical protein
LRPGAARRHDRVVLRALSALAVLAALLAAPARAGGDDVRAGGTCSGTSALSLRLREDDGRLRLEVELRSARRGVRWRFVVVHERRLVSRASLRAPAGGGALRLRRSLPDWYGTDTVVVRASRAVESCRVRAAL